MEGRHWLMLAIIFVLGGVVARVYAKPWQTVGLP